MINIIIDSNIIFSAILNSNSRIGQIIINGFNFYNFIAPQYVRSEILEHQDKIKETGKFSEKEFIKTYKLIIRNVTILSHSIIPKKITHTHLDYVVQSILMIPSLLLLLNLQGANYGQVI